MLIRAPGPVGVDICTQSEATTALILGARFAWYVYVSESLFGLHDVCAFILWDQSDFIIACCALHVNGIVSDFMAVWRCKLLYVWDQCDCYPSVASKDVCGLPGKSL